MLMHENITWIEIIDHPGKCLNAFKRNFQIPILNEYEKKYVKIYSGNIVISRTQSSPLGKKCSLLQDIWSRLQEKKSFKSALPVQILSRKTQQYPWADATSHSTLWHWNQFTGGLSISSGCPRALVAASYYGKLLLCPICCTLYPRTKQWGFLQREYCSGWKETPGAPSPASAQLSPRRSDGKRWEHEGFLSSGWAAGGSAGRGPLPARL